MTNSKAGRAPATKRAPLIRIAGHRVQALAEAGADGRELTAFEVRAVCEALRARGLRVPTQFHSGV